jgi:Tfp pilus assembly PilM family ATPase
VRAGWENQVARFLAIDWDQNLLHVIAANVSGGSVKVQHAAVWEEERCPTRENAEELGPVLRERLKSAGIAPAPVLACVGRDRVILKDLRFPAVPEDEEPTLVRFQALKELVDSPEDVVLDYAPMGKMEEAAPAKGEEGGERRALAVIVRRDVLAAHQAVCQAAGLKLAGLAPRALGLIACLRKVMGTSALTPEPEPAGATVALVAVGVRCAEFCIFHGDTLVLCRSLPAGPNLAGEVRRNLAVHDGQASRQPVQAVYVGGRGSGEVRQRLVELIELPVHTYDPFALAEHVDIPPPGRGTFAGAAGLLFAWARQGRLAVNFVQPRQAQPKVSPNFRLAAYALVAVLLVFFLSTLVTRGLYAITAGEEEDVRNALVNTEEDLKKAQEDAKRLKALGDWEPVVWLDELYDLARRIPDVNALRITSISADQQPRTAKARLTASYTIKGKLLGKRNARAPLTQLVNEFKKEGYRLGAPKVEKDQFTLTVTVERRAPADYKGVLDVPLPPKDGAKAGPPGKGTSRTKGKGKKGRPRMDDAE